MEKVKNQLLIDINKIEDTSKLVQIFELTAYKLNLKTITNYAKENNMSYNGVKKFRSKINVDGISFICDKLNNSNLPF